MRSTTTRKEIELQLQELNELLGRPIMPYVKVMLSDGKYRLLAQIGNIHIYHDINGYQLHEMCNESGGVRDVTYKWLKTKRELSGWLDGAIYAARKKVESVL